MRFAQTGLPNRYLLRSSFTAGWAKFSSVIAGQRAISAFHYMQGPAAMARLVLNHGGDNHETAAAACLAGPAAFSLKPDPRIEHDVLCMAHEVMSIEDMDGVARDIMIAGLSSNARIFLQASAIMLLSTLVDEIEQNQSKQNMLALQASWVEAQEIYASARGTKDTHRMDTAFTVAGMKITTLLGDKRHIWSCGSRKRQIG